jgi:hypothetical protein
MWIRLPWILLVLVGALWDGARSDRTGPGKAWISAFQPSTDGPGVELLPYSQFTHS